MTSSKNPVRRMDVTISIRWCYEVKTYVDTSASEQRVIDRTRTFFESHCSKWVFQVEDTKDNMHLQCRIAVKQRQRTSSLFRKLVDFLEVPEGWVHVTPSSNATANFCYVMKKESRIEGPWSNMDLLAMETEDLLQETPMEEWQKFIANKWLDTEGREMYNRTHRRVLFCVDTVGGSGKSVLVNHLALTRQKDCLVMPVTGTPQQMISAIIDAGPRSNYVLDFPRTKSRDKEWVQDMLFVLENLQNGMLVSCFYGKYKIMSFRRPQIVVFSNWKLPELLSKDRYVYIDPKNFVEPEC